ncbi:hypothetical protein F511_34243 [Dorcoceras hygrometricum]|uniref:Uncharacterized protein n=1 Tax=Dorcoceras hygrometricum TaxID=472368 RepID=A0A2Z7B2R1_9LAMI|nr:hypothetical protein F511_34243 [Dorcoceras hygrometricum]
MCSSHRSASRPPSAPLKVGGFIRWNLARSSSISSIRRVKCSTHPMPTSHDCAKELLAGQHPPHYPKLLAHLQPAYQLYFYLSSTASKSVLEFKERATLVSRLDTCEDVGSLWRFFVDSTSPDQPSDQVISRRKRLGSEGLLNLSTWDLNWLM